MPYVNISIFVIVPLLLAILAIIKKSRGAFFDAIFFSICSLLLIIPYQISLDTAEIGNQTLQIGVRIIWFFLVIWCFVPCQYWAKDSLLVLS
jgi:hypothetical protein